MTTVVAVESPEGVAIAYDSQVSGAYVGAGVEKFFMNGEVGFLFTGVVRDANILRYLHLPAVDTWDIDAWVTRALIPAIRQGFNDHEITQSNREERSMDSMFLAIVRGRVYEVNSWFGWYRNADGIYALGSGYAFALGAIYGGASVKDAMKVAKRLDPYTGGKIHLDVIRYEEAA